MGFVVNLKAETGLVDRSENTTRFYKDDKNYKPFDKDEEIEWFTKLKEAKENMKRLEKSLDRESYIKACRDYEKMLYELKKAAKKNKQHVKPLKEIQLSVNIAKHDLETKANNAKRFIEDGSRVRVTLAMKGRELSRREDNKKSILEFIVMMDDVAVPESTPKDEGNKTVVILKKRS